MAKLKTRGGLFIICTSSKLFQESSKTFTGGFVGTACSLPAKPARPARNENNGTPQRKHATPTSSIHEAYYSIHQSCQLRAALPMTSTHAKHTLYRVHTLRQGRNTKQRCANEPGRKHDRLSDLTRSPGCYHKHGVNELRRLPAASLSSHLEVRQEQRRLMSLGFAVLHGGPSQGVIELHRLVRSDPHFVLPHHKQDKRQ